MPTVSLMIPVCPHCQQVIVPDDINVAKDLAYCRPCNAAHQLSTLVYDNATTGSANLQDPPAGVTYVNDTRSTLIRASHRSWGAALGLLAISLFWNGIVSVFVLVALSGTLHQLGITAPDWFPAPKMDGENMGKGEVLFLWIFLTPFILIGSGMIFALLSTLVGKTEVRIGHDEGAVFVGIGPVGWTRRFATAQVERVDLRERKNQDGRGSMEIQLEHTNGKKITFGTLLNEERQSFIVNALRQTLVHRPASKRRFSNNSASP